MLEKQKIETIRNKEIISESLFERGLASEIIDHPRYESILWKLSNMCRSMGFKSNIDKIRIFTANIVSIDSDGSIIIFEGKGDNNAIVTSKYVYDEQSENLKRLKIENGQDGMDTKIISIYNDDGIEESMRVEQTTEYGKYLSEATRVENRIDVIKLSRIIQMGEQLERLPDEYQMRAMWSALEDIEPDAETIDPFERMPYKKLGVPEIYRDLSLEEREAVKNTNFRIIPLPQKYREDQLREYKENNKFYGRTRAFEKGVAKYLLVKDKSLDND